MATPYVFHFEEEVTSTQDIARLRYDGRPLVWAAARQTAGRGRRGRAWLTADDALAVSIAFEPTWEEASWPALSLVAGLSAVTVLEHHGVAEVRLKWPNDVYRHESKIGGILTEVSGSLTVVGLGLNLRWQDPPDGMAGLWTTPIAAGFRPQLAQDFAGTFLDRCARGPKSWGVEDYRRHCDTVGRDIVWQPDGAGRVLDVAPDGALVVQHDADVFELRSGEVTEVRSLS